MAKEKFFEERCLWIKQLNHFEEMVQRTIQSSLVTEKSDILHRDISNRENSDIPGRDSSHMNNIGISYRDTSSNNVPSEGNSHVLHIPVSTTGVSLQVEHIVRGGCEHKIQSFSGSSLREGEVSFDEWSKQIELMLEDDSLSVTAKRQLLISSLCYPALDLARGMDQIPAEEILKDFTNMYASTHSGPSLLREFF